MNVKSNRAWREECEALQVKVNRMQNAINWAARSAHVRDIGVVWHAIGAILPELKALDDGAQLEDPEVKS